MAVDHEFTTKIRDIADGGGTYVGSLYTEEEVDALLNLTPHDAGNLSQALTEAVIARTTGIYVELAVQGPALSNITRAGVAKNQEHNTLIALEQLDCLRRLSPDAPDRDTFPCITPEDVNVATRSIDFPPVRPRGIALELMRVDDRNEASDTAFSKQLAVVQVLSTWSMGVGHLVTHIERAWGVNYVQQLVQQVSYAKIADLEQYMACGGKSCPRIGLSPNLSSLYTVIDKIHSSPMDVGYTGWFPGRSTMLAKFMLLSTNMFRGRGSHPTLSFHFNPEQFARFDPSRLHGLTFGEALPPHTSRRSVAAALPATADEYIETRSVYAVVSARDRNALAEALDVQSRATSAVLKVDFKKVTEAFNKDLMAAHHRAVPPEQVPVLDNIGARVQTILFSRYSNANNAEHLIELHGVAACMFGAISSKMSNSSVAAAWPILSHQCATGSLLRAIPIANARRIPEIAALVEATAASAPLRAVALYMWSRQCNSIAPKVMSARAVYTLYMSTGRLPTSVEGARRLNHGAFKRPFRVISKYLGKAVQPFTHMMRHSQRGSIMLKTMSLLQSNAREFAAQMKLDSKWLEFTSTKQTSAKAADRQRMRSVFSALREAWVKFYKQVADSYLDAARFLATASPQGKKLKAVRGGKDSVLDVEALHSMYAIEYACYTGYAAAYRFYSVKIPVEFPDLQQDESSVDMLKTTIACYRLALDRPGLMECSVDPKAGQLRSKSYLMKFMESAAERYVNTVNGLGADVSALNGMIMGCSAAAYRDSGPLLARTVNEGLRRDHLIARAARPVPAPAPAPVVAQAAPAHVAIPMDKMFEDIIEDVVEPSRHRSARGHFANASDVLYNSSRDVCNALERINENRTDDDLDTVLDDVTALAKICRSIALESDDDAASYVNGTLKQLISRVAGTTAEDESRIFM